MKYNQYLEFEELLKENNLSVDDVKENPEVLNEAGLGILGAIVGGALALMFRKRLLSAPSVPTRVKITAKLNLDLGINDCI